jgi:phosphoglucomutase
LISSLLAAEITARMERDPSEIYCDLTREFGKTVFERVDAPATPAEKILLSKLMLGEVLSKELTGEKIINILTKAPGNKAAIGGLKVVAENGWFAARPSGTENIYKIYAESFLGADHLHSILEEAQVIVSDTLAVGSESLVDT